MINEFFRVAWRATWFVLVDVPKGIAFVIFAVLLVTVWAVEVTCVHRWGRGPLGVIGQMYYRIRYFEWRSLITRQRV